MLQSYPSPVPRAAENRYPEADNTRLVLGGCPFYDADLDYARDVLIYTISDNLEAVARSKGVQFLRLTEVFQGREVCATASSQSLTFPTPTTSEWARMLDLGRPGRPRGVAASQPLRTARVRRLPGPDRRPTALAQLRLPQHPGSRP